MLNPSDELEKLDENPVELPNVEFDIGFAPNIGIAELLVLVDELPNPKFGLF